MDHATREQLITLYNEWARIADAASPNLPTTKATLARLADIDAQIAALREHANA